METWYVLEDGSVARPGDVNLDRLSRRYRHKDGRAVAYCEDGETPRSRGVDPEVERPKRKQPFGGKGDHDGDGKPGGSVPSVGADMKPEEPPAEKPRRGYKTRETKGD